LLNKSCVLFFVHMSLKIVENFVRTKYLVHGTLSIIYIFTTHKISLRLAMLYCLGSAHISISSINHVHLWCVRLIALAISALRHTTHNIQWTYAISKNLYVDCILCIACCITSYTATKYFKNLCYVGYRANLSKPYVPKYYHCNRQAFCYVDHCSKRFLCSIQFDSKYSFSKLYLAVVETIFFYTDISDNYNN